MPQREREREKQTLWMPEAWRTETAAVAVAPTKREATEKALKGMKWESPAWPLLKEDMAHPNWAALARAHQMWLQFPVPVPSAPPPSISSICDPTSTLPSPAFSSCSCSLALPTFFSVYLNFVVHSLISLSLYGLNLGFIPVGGWGLSFGFQPGVNGLYIDELMCGYENDTIYIIKQPAH